MKRWVMSVMCGLVVTAGIACSPDTGTEVGSTDAGRAEAGDSLPTVPPGEELPRPFGLVEGALFAPSFAAIHDGVWMYGGVEGSPGAWQGNREAFLYASDGSVQERTQVPVSEGSFLSYADSHLMNDGGALVIGNECATPTGEHPGCSAQPLPVAFEVTSAGFEARSLPGEWGSRLPSDETLGPIRLAGAVDGELLLTRDVGQGPVDEVPTFDVSAALIDDDLTRALPVPVPDGVLRKELMCGGDEGIFSVVPTIAEDLTVPSLKIWRQRPPAWSPELLTDLGSLSSVHLIGGQLHCAQGALVIQAESSEATEILVLDAATGSMIGEPFVLLDPRVPSVERTSGGDGFVITSWIGETVSETGEILDFMQRAQYVVADAQEGAREVGVLELGPNRRPHGVALAGEIFDISGWAKEPGIDNPPVRVST